MPSESYESEASRLSVSPLALQCRTANGRMLLSSASGFSGLVGVNVKSAFGALFAGGGEVTVTCLVWVSVSPSLSVTVKVTVYVLAAEYIRDGFRLLLVAPSPNVHAQLTIVPSESDLPSVKLPACSICGLVGENVKSALGATFAGGGEVMVIERISWSVAPSLSVTVRVTSYVPAVV